MSITAQSVADMEQELELAHATIAELQDRVIKAELDRDNLRDQLTLAQDERDDAIRLATQVETILEHTSMGLVQGVSKLRTERDQRKRRRNEIFEAAIAEGTTVPLFLRNQLRGRAAVTDKLVREGKGAVMTETGPDAGGRPDNPSKPLAARPAPDLGTHNRYNSDVPPSDDPRLPRNMFGNDKQPKEAPQVNLSELARSMGIKTSDIS